MNPILPVAETTKQVATTNKQKTPNKQRDPFWIASAIVLAFIIGINILRVVLKA